MVYVIAHILPCLLLAFLLGCLLAYLLRKVWKDAVVKSFLLPDFRQFARLSDLPNASKFALKSELPTAPDLSGYALKSELPKAPDLAGYALKSELPKGEFLTAEALTPLLAWKSEVGDLSQYARRSEIPDVSQFALKSELPKLPDLSPFALKADLPKPADLSGYALKSEIPAIAPSADMSQYALKSELPRFPDVSGFALKSETTTAPDLTGYVRKADLPDLSGYLRKQDVATLLAEKEQEIAALRAALAHEAADRASEIERLEALLHGNGASVAVNGEPAVVAPPPPIQTEHAKKPDNLQLIWGIGPVLARRLHSLGVHHFSQIAQWTERDVASFQEKLETVPDRIHRDEWIQQAARLQYEANPKEVRPPDARREK